MSQIASTPAAPAVTPSPQTPQPGDTPLNGAPPPKPAEAQKFAGKYADEAAFRTGINEARKAGGLAPYGEKVKLIGEDGLYATREAAEADAARGTLADFYREELDERREYGFPPFGLLVRATVAGKTPAGALKRAKELTGVIPGHEPSVYAGRDPLARGLVPAHALWKLPRDPWPDPEIVRALMDRAWELERQAEGRA